MDEVYWYRFIDYATAAGCDEDGDPIPGATGVEILLKKYKVLSETPKGVWVQDDRFFIEDRNSVPRRWVRRDARKRFACPTIEEAMESFIARKQRQAGIYEARVRFAKYTIYEAMKRYRRGAWGKLEDMESFKGIKGEDDWLYK